MQLYETKQTVNLAFYRERKCDIIFHFHFGEIVPGAESQ